MACENALGVGGTNHQAPNTIARLSRNIILGCEFLMSHITHFYTLAALSYVQGPSIPPWTPYFDNSYYVAVLQNPGRPVPDATKSNVPAEFAGAATYTGLDGIWDNVILDYVIALKYRRDAADASALLGGRTPMIQNGCVIGGMAARPSVSDVARVKELVSGGAGGKGIRYFIEKHQIPLTQIVSYLYGNTGGTETAVRDYDNDHSNVMSGKGAGAATGIGANRVLAWGVFDEDNNGGDNPNRLLGRGCYEWNGSSMAQVETPATLWSNLAEYIDNSRYDNDTTKGAHPKHPSSGYTKPNAATGYSWAKSPRISGKACQVGPLARMAVEGEREGSGAPGPGATGDCFSYAIGSTKALRITDHPLLGPILAANLPAVAGIYGALPASFLCGFSTMDRHRARAYEAAKIAYAVERWCDELTTYLNANPTQYGYTSWTAPSSTDGVVRSGYGAHEAPRGALAHFVEIGSGKISNYQCVVPTTWNVNPKANSVNGPIESAIIGINVSDQTSGGHNVAVEALRVVQGFDPCIACTVH